MTFRPARAIGAALFAAVLVAAPVAQAKVLASGTISGKRVELKGWHEDDLKEWAEKHGFAFGA